MALALAQRSLPLVALAAVCLLTTTASAAADEPAPTPPPPVEPTPAPTPAPAQPETTPAQPTPAPTAEPAKPQTAPAPTLPEGEKHEGAAATEGEKAKEEGKEKEGEGEEKEPDWEVAIDAAYGTTRTEVLSGGPASAPVPVNAFDPTRINVFSLLFGFERRFGERVTLGARMPLIDAELKSRTALVPSTNKFVVGNVELEGAYLLAKGEHWSLTGTLEVALPSATGGQPPSREEVDAEKGKTFNYKTYQSYAAVKAAGATRGSYESALFEPGNLGLIPKISAKINFGKLTVAPMFKIENMFDVAKEDETVYINEFIAGVRVSYLVLPFLEPGVHVWGRELHEHTNSDDSFSAVGVVEPYVQVPVKFMKFGASVIVPFAGDLADDKTIGARVTAAAEF